MANNSNSEVFQTRFTGKNYAAWEFQFQLFVMGKELWGHVDGSDPAPTDPTKLVQWKVQDARMMTWILGSVDPLLILNLKPHKTAKSMWECLKKVYHQDHSARRLQLETDLAAYSQGKGRGRDMRTVQCYSCKDYGHIAAHCAKKFCNYCKQKGHIIKECPTRPQNRPVNAYPATATGHTSDGVTSTQNLASVSPSTAATPALTPKMVQQMIVSAFSALGLQVKGSGVGEDNSEGA
ncbi:hypothetical protein F0562_006563 [Nyssa sinensis]|uniref:CCHC-type domain-containing protein n=1 Tax=Nyssa sinensis TaxID=561372 RepID=A0A5J5ARR3_9ASTE|nr:hypothetical protein F0562_006563 [Nyssa sinensis]